MKRTISLVALLATLVLSFLLDLGSVYLDARVRVEGLGLRSFDPDTLPVRVAGDVAADLIFVLAVIALAWWVLVRREQDAVVAWPFLAVGAMSLLYLPLLVAGPAAVVEFLTSSGFGALTRGFRATLLARGFGSYFGLAGAGAFAIGLLGLLRMLEHLPTRIGEQAA